MRKVLMLVWLAFTVAPAWAQFGTGAKATAVPPELAMPAGKIYVNRATLPRSRIGFSTERVGVSCTLGVDCNVLTTAPNSGVSDSALRVGCSFSHMSFDDPIVWPNRPGRTHLHAFFGNGNTRNSTDLDNMASSGNSSCVGGILNRTGYWTPTLIYHRPGHSRNGDVYIPASANFYYKTGQVAVGSDGGSGTADTALLGMVWGPPGLRMIGGNANNTTNTLAGGYDCYTSGGAGTAFDHIPTTAQGTAAGGCVEIVMRVVFPQCWDGLSLGGVNGYGHMVNATYGLGCPAEFPVFIPEVSFNVHWNVNNADLDHIRLSSDQPKATASGDCALASKNYCAGATLHGDWVNGWSENTAFLGISKSVTTVILEQCLRRAAPPYASIRADCHNHILGNPVAGSPNTVYTLQ